MSAPSALERELAEIGASPYLARLGVRTLEATQGKAQIELPSGLAIANRGGTVHGGAIATAVVVAGSLAAASTEQGSGVGRPLNLAVCYLKPVRGVGLMARAKVLDRGRDTIHVAADVYGEDEQHAAAGLLTYRMVADGQVPERGFARAWLTAEEERGLATAVPRRMSGSPYGQGSAVEILYEAPRAAAVRMPFGPNEGAGGVVHAGAVAGLIDNCGAFSSYVHPEVGFDRTGATVAMSIGYLAAVAGDLLGYSRLIARAGTAFTNQVQVWGTESGELTAVGTVSYRIVDK